MKTYFETITHFFNHNPFWQKWGGWIWASLFSVAFIALVGEDMVQGFIDGWNSYEPKNTSPEKITTFNHIIFFIGFCFGFAFFYVVISLFGEIYYATIHRFFFSKLKAGMLVAFVIFVFLLVEIISEIIEKYTDDIQTEYQIILLFCCCIAYSFIKDFYRKQKEQAELLRQKTEAELTSLKAQVNPHFLFNSLNNIYGTAIVEAAPQTANSLQQLSGIMRYVLEKSTVAKVNVADEIKFLNDYTQMHELRIAKRDNIDIKVNINWDELSAEIVPLLLSSVVENAFKYGISLEKPCFVHIDFDVTAGKLLFKTQNSIFANNDLEKGTGTGLDNLRQRLKLAYPDRHQLVLNENNGIFEVNLAIELI